MNNQGYDIDDIWALQDRVKQVQQKVVARRVRGGLQGIGTVIVCPITHSIVQHLIW